MLVEPSLRQTGELYRSPIDVRFSYLDIDLPPEFFDVGNDERDRVLAWMSELTQLGFYGDVSIENAIRRERTRIDTNNPATKELWRGLPGVYDWAKLVPTAAALDPFYNPDAKEFIGGASIPSEFRRWIGIADDSREIARRGMATEAIISEEMRRLRNDGVSTVYQLSLASGAAQPIINAVERVAEEEPVGIDVTLVDIDRNMLTLAGSYFNKIGGGDGLKLHPVCMNILRPDGFVREGNDGQRRDFVNESSRNWLASEQYHIGEAIGITEYLTDGGNDRRAGVPCFLKNAFKAIKPGGLLVVGNMLKTHPQLGFTLNVVQWLYIQPRSSEEMLKLIEKAELPIEDVTIYTMGSGVYALYAIRKQKEESHLISQNGSRWEVLMGD